MPLYFLLGDVTENGHRNLRANPDLVVDSVRACNFPDAQILSQYAVLGRYDFVMLAEADDNDAVARLSLEMSVRVGMHIETLPAIAMRLQAQPDDPPERTELAYADAPAGEDWDFDDREPDQPGAPSL